MITLNTNYRVFLIFSDLQETNLVYQTADPALTLSHGASWPASAKQPGPRRRVGSAASARTPPFGADRQRKTSTCELPVLGADEGDLRRLPDFGEGFPSRRAHQRGFL